MRKIILIAWILISAHTVNGCLKDSDVLSRVISRAGDILKQPASNEGDGLNVLIGLDIYSFSIIPHSSTLEIDAIVTKEWIIPSLDFSQHDACHNSLSLDNKNIQIWVPKLSIANAADSTVRNDNADFKLSQNGTLIHSQRVKQSVPCKTVASTYPFGNTTCTLIWRNEENGDVVKFNWKDTVVETQEAGDLILRSTHLEHQEPDSDSGSEYEFKLNFNFIRGPHKILFLFYLPSLIFMIIPLLSLLLGPMAITRCIMNMTSMILIMLHYSFNMSGLPDTNGITAIDIWKIFSFVFILGIIIELVIVTLLASLGRSRTCRKSRKGRKGKYEMEPLYEEMNDLRERTSRKTSGCCRMFALTLDLCSFILFTVAWIAFSVAYYFERDVIVRWINDVNLETLKILYVQQIPKEHIYLLNFTAQIKHKQVRSSYIPSQRFVDLSS